MNSVNRSVCPIAYMNHCLYDHCPCWDKAREECDASCPQDQDAGDSSSPCTSHGTEDFD